MCIRSFIRVHPRQRGFSLFELFMVIGISSILMASISLIFQGGLKSWDGGYKRYKMKRNLALTLERMSKDLRQARSLVKYCNVNDTIQFSISEKQPDGTYVVNTYVYYLYSPDDTWKPRYRKQYIYQLKRVLESDFQCNKNNYGKGVRLLEDIPSPKDPTTDNNIKIGGNNFVTLDFSASADDETVNMRTKVKSRNVP